MYLEWSALNLSSGEGSNGDKSSVLDKLTPEAAKDVVLPVVRHVVSSLGISQAPQSSSFTTDPEIEWCLQVSNSTIVPQNTCSGLLAIPIPLTSKKRSRSYDLLSDLDPSHLASNQFKSLTLL